ncbi:hypothetical protein ABW20_dc0109057 [Dactylellina cionopaga]|nr:hypothetical protein ABW20_dc0109057 [Dactylellina cionopaga]
MIGFTKASIAIAAALGLLGTVTAAPAPVTEIDYVSLIETAPGYPTVQELGLTNADLMKPVPALDGLVAREMLEKRYQPQCWGEPKCGLNEARACFNYLNSIGGNNCDVNGRIQMCKLQGCAWDARTLNNGFARTSCSNAALGGAWVLNNCNGGGRTSGTNAAFGNGNMIIDIIGR